jgi:T5SS/PEP-CTERM-associated repeat protein
VTHFYVGADAGEGVVNLLDGAAIDYSSEVKIAYGLQSAGAINVDGASFKAGSFGVGDGGRGKLGLRNAGSASAVNTFVGYYGVSDGHVTVEGAGSNLANSGVLSVGRYGRAEVIVTNGGSIQNGSDMNVADQSGHAKVTVAGPFSTIASRGSLAVGAAASRGGSGELHLASGGSITAGRGIVLSDTSRLSFTADDFGEGLLAAGGRATLGGILSFDFAEGYAPVAGSTFDLITASSFSGGFGQFVTDESVRLIYGPQSVSVQVVPEPSAVALAGMAVAGLLVLRPSRGSRLRAWKKQREV